MNSTSESDFCIPFGDFGVGTTNSDVLDGLDASSLSNDAPVIETNISFFTMDALFI